MKKYFIFLVLILTMILFGCSNTLNEETNSKTTSATKKIRVSAMSPDDHPSMEVLKEFKEDVQEQSNGSLELEIFPANQLGDYTSVYEEVMKGTIDMAFLSAPSQIDSRMEVLNMPYLVEDYDDARERFSTDSYLYSIIDEVLEEQNIQLLGLGPIGFGGIGTTRQSENHDLVDGDKGLMVRVPEMNVYQQYAEAMGFNTVSIPYADVFTALQTGTADGVIGAPAADNYVSFRDVITHYYQYNNTFEAQVLIMNLDLWDSLTDEEKSVLQDTGENFTLNMINKAEETDEKYIKKLKEEGIEVIEYTAEEIKSFSDHIREKVWPQSKDVVGQDIIESLLKGKE